MRLTVSYDFLPKERSLNTGLVMDHFGVDFEQGRHVIAEDLELDVQAGDLVFFTGPSGSGKSSLLRELAQTLERQSARVLWIDRLTLPAVPLVDALPLPVRDSLDLLSACGLGEAQLLLRTPAELSDGQRYRFRLALGLATIGCRPSAAGSRPAARAGSRPPKADSRPKWLVADEFSAALDRTLAKVLAFNLRRLSRRSGVGFLLATTHEDLLDDLDPDVLVRCDLDSQIRIERRHDAIHPIANPKSQIANAPRAVSFFASSGSVKAPSPIGRTSLGGITAATR